MRVWLQMCAFVRVREHVRVSEYVSVCVYVWDRWDNTGQVGGG